MHHQRMWTSSLAVIPQTLSLPPADMILKKLNKMKKTGRGFTSVQMFHTHTHPTEVGLDFPSSNQAGTYMVNEMIKKRNRQCERCLNANVT